MQIGRIEDIQRKGKVIILGHGPSVDKILPMIGKLSKSYDIMTLNDWWRINEALPVNFLVCSSPYSILYPEFVQKLRKDIFYFFKATEIIDEDDNEKIHGVDYFKYRFRTEIGYDIHRALQDKTGGQLTESGASTIVICIVLSVLMEYSEIYYTGVELDSRFRYGGVKNETRKWDPDCVNTWSKLENEMDMWRPSICDQIQKIKNSAMRINIPVVDITYMSEKQMKALL